VIEHEVQDFFEGSYLFTWNEIEAKFDKLTTDHTTAESRRDIKDAVRSLESIQVADLMEPLGRERAPTRQR
jgi:hypothetical protein